MFCFLHFLFIRNNDNCHSFGHTFRLESIQPHRNRSFLLLYKPFSFAAAYFFCMQTIEIMTIMFSNDHYYDLRDNFMHVYHIWFRLTSHYLRARARASVQMPSKLNSLSVRQCEVRDFCQIVVPTIPSGPATERIATENQINCIFTRSGMCLHSKFFNIEIQKNKFMNKKNKQTKLQHAADLSNQNP